MNIKPITLKWQFVATYGRDYWRLPEYGWRSVTLGIIRLKYLPGEGTAIGKDDYDGFLLRFRFWKPIELQ